MKIPYKKYPAQTKSGFCYSAIIPVNIALPSKYAARSKRFEAVIDSGATNCVFHADIGRAIGLEVDKGESSSTLGISGPSNLFLHDIWLYAPGGPIEIKAGFSEELPLAGLLGMSGFFDSFRITFDPTALRCELERIYKA